MLLVEAYNKMEEGPKRTNLLSQICEKNLQIIMNSYGKESLFSRRVILTAYTASIGKEGQNEKTTQLYERLFMCKRGEKLITANRFMFKARLQGILVMMQSPDPVRVAMVQKNLEVALQQMIDYLEGDRTHPFLEEIIILYASYMENSQQFLSALALYSLFLRIQTSLFGEECAQMIKTYQTMSDLAMQIPGSAGQGQKYLEKAQELQDKYGTPIDETTMSEEQLKAHRQKEAAILFKQYLAAEQTGDLKKALEHIQAQSKVLGKLFGDCHTRLCSNLYLQSKIQMKLCKLDEALASMNDACAMKEKLVSDFGDDL
jgi:hypothetical protein